MRYFRNFFRLVARPEDFELVINFDPSTEECEVIPVFTVQRGVYNRRFWVNKEIKYEKNGISHMGWAMRFPLKFNRPVVVASFETRKWFRLRNEKS